MKSKLLKKLRKDVSWRFEGNKVAVLNHKLRRVNYYTSINDFVEWVALEYFGIGTWSRFFERSYNRRRVAEYKVEISKTSNQ